MTNLQINSNTYAKPMTDAAKKFFASPSKLSKGRRFKGTIKTMSHMAACTEQSGATW